MKFLFLQSRGREQKFKTPAHAGVICFGTLYVKYRNVTLHNLTNSKLDCLDGNIATMSLLLIALV